MSKSFDPLFALIAFSSSFNYIIFS